MAPETFATLINRKLLVPSSKTTYFAIHRDVLVDLLAPLLATVEIDELWYLAQSPDVAEAIDRGEFASATEHFVRVGYYEHRMPYQIDVDEPWYLDSYPDVAEAVETGAFADGTEHFYSEGYREGRFPHANFELKFGYKWLGVNSASNDQIDGQRGPV